MVDKHDLEAFLAIPVLLMLRSITPLIKASNFFFMVSPPCHKVIHFANESYAS